MRPTLDSIKANAPKNTYHAKIRLAERTENGGFKVVRIAHLTDLDNDPLGAICVENTETEKQEYSCSDDLKAMMASLVVERIDYLVNPFRFN